MKKQILLSMLTVAALFCSCSKQDDPSQLPDTAPRQVTFTLSAADDAAPTRTVDDADASTRATTTVTLNRYVMEVYTDATCTQQAHVFDNGTSHRKEQTTPTFSITLNGQDRYYCLFWADNAAAAVYDVTTLKAVTLKSGATAQEGYHGMLAVTQAQVNHSVTLKRAVAKVTLNETDKIKPSSSLKTTYARHTTFDVSTATVGNAQDVEIITPISNAVNGTSGAPVRLAEFYTFAAAGGEIGTFRFTLNSEPVKEVTNIPLKANRITHLKGEFSGLTSATLIATSTTSDDWGGDKEYSF